MNAEKLYEMAHAADKTDLLVLADWLTENGREWEGVACRYMAKKGIRPHYSTKYLHSKAEVPPDRRWAWYSPGIKKGDYVPKIGILPLIIFNNLPGVWGGTMYSFYPSGTAAVTALGVSLRNVYLHSGLSDILEESWSHVHRLKSRRNPGGS